MLGVGRSSHWAPAGIVPVIRMSAASNSLISPSDFVVGTTPIDAGMVTLRKLHVAAFLQYEYAASAIRSGMMRMTSGSRSTFDSVGQGALSVITSAENPSALAVLPASPHSQVLRLARMPNVYRSDATDQQPPGPRPRLARRDA